MCILSYTHTHTHIQVWLDNVQCNGDETSIFHCNNNGWGSLGHLCSNSYEAGVVCTNNRVNPYPVVLKGGANDTEGRVEIFYNGNFGTICNDKFSMEAANVVCRSLNFTGAVNYTRNDNIP